MVFDSLDSAKEAKEKMQASVHGLVVDHRCNFCRVSPSTTNQLKYSSQRKSLTYLPGERACLSQPPKKESKHTFPSTASGDTLTMDCDRAQRVKQWAEEKKNPKKPKTEVFNTNDQFVLVM